jgi:hypothetical protein
VYATCLHCHRDLGRNEAIEEFPIGRRLAFDSAKGRLWVVCPACQRWNLTPIEERWEAVESCERLFRGQRLRSQTDNIGLTRISEGTELIRIGSPLRPEFAAWRYGAVFRRRLERRSALVAGGSAAAAGALAMAGVGLANTIAIAAAPIIALPLAHMAIAALLLRNNVRKMTLIGEDGKSLRVTRANLNHTTLAIGDDGAMHLRLRHEYGRQELVGDRAARAINSILARANSAGGRASTVRDAVDLIADAGDPTAALQWIARDARRRSGDFDTIAAEIQRGAHGRTVRETMREQQRIQSRSGFHMNGVEPRNKGALHHLPAAYRLALEMAMHESTERHAFDEELASLERAWREAEEIAAIADDLLVPPSVATRIDQGEERDPSLRS